MRTDQSSPEVDLDAPLIFVSADSHIGPRLREDLRDYCPKEHLEAFDDYIRASEPELDPGKVSEMFVADSSEFDGEHDHGLDMAAPPHDPPRDHHLPPRLNEMYS